MVGLAGTSYVGKQYDITCKVNGYLPDGSSERRAFYIALKREIMVNPLETIPPRFQV